MSATRHQSHPRLRGDQGSAMAEFALLAPFLILLTLGILEFGFAWRDVQVVERTTEAAGRAVSTFGAFDSSFADYDALRAVSAGLAGLDRAEVQKVVIYRATTADGEPSAACRTASPPGIAGQCNVYSASQVNTTNPSGFPRGDIQNPTCAAGSWDSRWCFTTRSRDIVNGAHFVGVWVEVDYESLTGLLPATVTIERKAVFQLEPLPNLPDIP
jgi:Flp pilus assembly protein TadG